MTYCRFLHSIKYQFLRVYPHLKPHILFDSSGLAIQHCLPNTRHMQVNNGRYAAILNLIKSNFSGCILP